MTTAEIVAVLRREAWATYFGVIDDDAPFLHTTADALRRAAKRLARLADDELAARVAKDCHDPHHDVRWCSTCEARGDGIDAYRRAVQGGSK